MCTVTYIPINEKYFITSNRDEKNVRGTALHPAVYEINGKKLIYPKDANAGGTWIALHENGNAAVLLNGAFEKHIPRPPYRSSRGIILLEIISNERPARHFHQMDLSNMEPFTLILSEQENLYEYRWDGRIKYGRQLKKHRPYIWSSATLYDKDTVSKREQWFADFLNNNPNPTQQDILSFHRFSGNEDHANNLVMKRENIYSTVSITSIFLTAERASMKYLDLKHQTMNERKIELQVSLEKL
jgi:uncharacterized protein with NRDE domain